MEKINGNKFNKKFASKKKSEMYQIMYQSLFKEISKALSILSDQNNTAIESAKKILKNAQCETEEIFINSEQCNGLYSAMQDRLNLQSLGYFLKEESTLNFIHSTSFTKRDHDAEKALNETLSNMLDVETAKKIYPEIVSYTSIKEEIQSSLGMKTGAKLAILLTDDPEYDY